MFKSNICQKSKSKNMYPPFLSRLKIKLKSYRTIKKLIITNQNEFQRRNHR